MAVAVRLSSFFGRGAVGKDVAPGDGERDFRAIDSPRGM